jgi:hypothetical protein
MNADPLLATGPIALWILVAGLFFPRLTLFVAWLASGYPPNPLPVLADFFLWLILPRFLMAFYIYTDMGMNNLWFWAYIITGIVGCFGETNVGSRVIRRRTTVSRDGRTTTTVEEEEV